MAPGSLHAALDREAFAALCLHEAAHAAVAEALGLAVEEIDLTGTMRAHEVTGEIYGIPVGSELPAAGTRIPDEFLETHPLELLAAMAAPAYLETGVAQIDLYGSREAKKALELARQRGIEPNAVAELARSTVAAQGARIRELAGVLERDRSWRPADDRRSSRKED